MQQEGSCEEGSCEEGSCDNTSCQEVSCPSTILLLVREEEKVPPSLPHLLHVAFLGPEKGGGDGPLKAEKSASDVICPL